MQAASPATPVTLIVQIGAPFASVGLAPPTGPTTVVVKRIELPSAVEVGDPVTVMVGVAWETVGVLESVPLIVL